MSRTALLAARARRIPPGAGRQGGRRMERAGDRGAGRVRRAVRPAGPRRGRPRSAARLLTGVHLARRAAAADLADGPPGANAGVLEDYADVAEGLLALHGVTGDAGHRGWRGAAGHRARPVRRRGRRVLRHRRRRRAAVPPPAGPDRQRDAVRPVRGGGRAAVVRGADRSARHRRAAEGALAPATALAEKHARFAGLGLGRGGGAASTGPVEVAVVGDRRTTRAPGRCTGRR